MLLEGLTALALSLSFSLSQPLTSPDYEYSEVNYVVNNQNISTNTDYYNSYFCGYYGFSLGTHSVGQFRLNLHQDDNYNEYIELNFDIDFGNTPYIYYSWDNWLQYDYNVSLFATYRIYDNEANSYVFDYTTTTAFLVSSDYGYPSFSGDSDVLSFTPVLLHTYDLYMHVYLNLIPNLDFSTIGHDEYQSGYDTGYNDGYTSGFDDGEVSGSSSGYDEGYNNGYNTGHTQGYQDGYTTALSGHNFSFTNLFASIGDTPILMIRRLFGFEIFGTSVIAIFMSLFTALIIIKVIKRVF